MTDSASSLVPYERISSRILLLRGEKVIVDNDLAELYGVTPKALLQQVRRNLDRFPADFMFQLDEDKSAKLRALSTTRKRRRVGNRPFAFTEQGGGIL